MKASELICALSSLMKKYGDLEIMYDADSVLAEPESVAVLNDSYSASSVFVICSPAQERNPGIANTFMPRH